MTNISRHPLLKQAYEVCLAIEECGASVPLTNAATRASDLLRELDKALPENTAAMTFGQAIESMKAGQCVARAGWNGKGMFIYLIKGSELQTGLKYGFGEYLGEPTFMSTICMKTADNKLVVGWLASQTDILSDDWSIVGDAL